MHDDLRFIKLSNVCRLSIRFLRITVKGSLKKMVNISSLLDLFLCLFLVFTFLVFDYLLNSLALGINLIYKVVDSRRLLIPTERCLVSGGKRSIELSKVYLGFYVRQTHTIIHLLQ